MGKKDWSPEKQARFEASKKRQDIEEATPASLAGAFEDDKTRYEEHRIKFLFENSVDPTNFPVMWNEVEPEKQKKFLSWLSRELGEKIVFIGLTEAELNELVTSEDQGPALEKFDNGDFEKPSLDDATEEEERAALIKAFEDVFAKGGIVFTSHPMDEEPVFIYSIDEMRETAPNYIMQDWYTIYPKQATKEDLPKVEEKKKDKRIDWNEFRRTVFADIAERVNNSNCSQFKVLGYKYLNIKLILLFDDANEVVNFKYEDEQVKTSSFFTKDFSEEERLDQIKAFVSESKRDQPEEKTK